jgi:hypothetical protein
LKYISHSRIGWNHRPYWQYLESVKDFMPAHLFEFASNPENHDLKSPNSLHDSWLEYWRIAETAKNNSKGERSSQIDACFLGPKHDRYIHFTYKNVEKHAVEYAGELTISPRQTPHGDLLVHELAIVREGVFSHELVFSKGAVFMVQFTDFDHNIELVEPRAG